MSKILHSKFIPMLKGKKLLNKMGSKMHIKNNLKVLVDQKPL